ncbi:hypothetical protein [Shewanella sedimentimangrovi]|uniref:Uncharacterized protein n=1 Tax=Shewanella sedimentimangrovi TaxID=2814293 RepID=A0ABX7R0S2_9GAMM|nr:hypothetical protein [Shewanella sedimentimangrovi]QSX37392.1 hypothetical protein JYB85_00600 [Shewanella sedimentimangrovi]
MALTRRQWNNTIIIASLLMVSVLTVLDRRTSQVPSGTSPLFDAKVPLTELQLDGVWLSRGDDGWHCDPQVISCSDWADAWLQLEVSPLSEAPAETKQPRELLLRIANQSEGQVWLLFADGLLKSPAGNWYLIPPSRRESLEPVLLTH